MRKAKEEKKYGYNISLKVIIVFNNKKSIVYCMSCWYSTLRKYFIVRL